MSIISDSITLYTREMLIFKANLRANVMRSLIFPLVLILFFGNIGSSITNAPVAVVNYANNLQSFSFINEMQNGGTVQVSTVTDENTALSELQSGTVQLVVLILPNFPSTNPSSPGVEVYYSNVEITLVDEVLPVIEQDAESFGSSVGQQTNSLTVKPSSTGEVITTSLYGTSGSYRSFLVGGIVPMVVIFSALFGGGMTLISDRQLGNLKAFIITPVSKNSIVISRIMAGATQGLLAAYIALAIGMLFGVTIAMGLLGLAYISLVAVLVSAIFSSIAIMIASRIKKVDVYAIFSQAVGLPLWFISGGIIPIQSLPSWLVPLATVDPLTYATAVSRAAILQGFIPLSTFAFDVGVLLITAIAFMLLAFRVFKNAPII